MTQTSVKRSVFMGIRLVCGVVFLWLLYRSYLHSGYLAVVSALCLVVTTWGFNYSQAQGRKLANENMRKAGLKPDRD